MELAGKAALVTGGARMGVTIGSALAARGTDVAFSYHRSSDAVEGAAAAVRDAGRRGVAIRADLSQAAGCEQLVSAAVDALGRLDILVLMASVYAEVPFEQLTEAAWRTQMRVDLDSTLHCVRAALPHLRRAGGGRVVTFSDWTAASSRPRYRGWTGYYVAKAGVKALTESLALELAADGILVNAIAPGPVLPPPEASAEQQAAVRAATPLGRWGGPEAVAQALVLIVESDFMTGETIRVDGGRHVK
ncbi:MAG: SDR family oxidoreductase [Luteitalea sp.]|nr:SDR family oxidoreductase [Luteitalea sp.]